MIDAEDVRDGKMSNGSVDGMTDEIYMSVSSQNLTDSHTCRAGENKHSVAQELHRKREDSDRMEDQKSKKTLMTNMELNVHRDKKRWSIELDSVSVTNKP